MQTSDRVQELDGLRGLAILLVVLFHFAPPVPQNASAIQHFLSQVLQFGWCGVDLFFVLSGFLITGILLDSKGSANYFSVFYARRALRILPLYYFVLLGFFRIVQAPPSQQLWLWFHLSNWTTAFHPYVPLTHMWSLAIEEQFYLLWPLVVLLCPRRFFWPLCAFLIAACSLARNLSDMQALSHQYPNFLYRLTPFRMDSLIFGACAAVIVRDPRRTALGRRFLPTPLCLGLAILAAVVAAAQSTSPHTEPMTRFGFLALGLTFSSTLLYIFWNTGGNGIVPRFFRSRALIHLGQNSYAIYVLHPFLRFVHIDTPWNSASVFLTLLARIAASFLAARLSWYCLERHFWKLKRQMQYRDPILPEPERTATYPPHTRVPAC